MITRGTILALLALLLIFGTVVALSDSIDRLVISSGGGFTQNGNYSVHGTVGQPVAGVTGNGLYELHAGFWNRSIRTPVLPEAFSKNEPENLATEVSTNPLLSWETSVGAAGYEYCYDTTDNDSCDTTWIPNGTDTSTALSALAEGTVYYWHVRAINTDGTTYSNGSETTFWSFTTVATYEIFLPIVLN